MKEFLVTLAGVLICIGIAKIIFALIVAYKRRKNVKDKRG